MFDVLAKIFISHDKRITSLLIVNLSPSIYIYLHLSPSISIYLHLSIDPYLWLYDYCVIAWLCDCVIVWLSFLILFYFISFSLSFSSFFFVFFLLLLIYFLFFILSFVLSPIVHMWFINFILEQLWLPRLDYKTTPNRQLVLINLLQPFSVYRFITTLQGSGRDIPWVRQLEVDR